MSVSSTIEKGQRRTWHQWKATGLLGLHEKLNAKRLEALMASLQGHGFGFGNTHFWPWFSRPSLVPCHLFSVEVGNWDWEQHFLVFFCFLVLFAPTSERRNEGAPEYAPGTWKRTSSLTTHFHTHSLTCMDIYFSYDQSLLVREWKESSRVFPRSSSTGKTDPYPAKKEKEWRQFANPTRPLVVPKVAQQRPGGSTGNLGPPLSFIAVPSPPQNESRAPISRHSKRQSAWRLETV